MTKFSEDIPGSFRIVAILAIVWMLAGCASYYMHVTMTPADIAALPQGQQTFMNNSPSWVYALFGIASWGGLAGAVLLFMKRRLAVPLLLVSLVAAVLQVLANYFVQDAWNLLGGPVSLFMPVLIIGLGLFFWDYARTSAAKGWLQ